MSSSNRGDRIQLLQKVLKKHYKPVSAVEGRSVLEQLVFASCLEDAAYEAAEEAFQRVLELYFDWNEVRVTTVTELADALRNLPDPTAAAARIKRSLQSIFESRYSFDLEDMRKMNQGKAIQELEKFGGVSRYMLAYVTQHALGGHTIPVSNSIMHILVMTGVVTQAEADKHQTPGLERAIPKSKGLEFSSCLHQMAAEYRANPAGKNIKAILKEAGGVEPVKVAEPPKAAPAAKPAIAAKPKKPETLKPETKETKETRESKDSKTSKAAAAKPATKGATKSSKPIKDAKQAKDTKKPAVSKKELPPKKTTKAKPAAAPAAKKPVVKKITKRKPK